MEDPHLRVVRLPRAADRPVVAGREVHVVMARAARRVAVGAAREGAQHCQGGDRVEALSSPWGMLIRIEKRHYSWIFFAE